MLQSARSVVSIDYLDGFAILCFGRALLDHFIVIWLDLHFFCLFDLDAVNLVGVILAVIDLDFALLV